MKFCSECGQPVTCRIPAGDNRLRCVCDACGTVHYENPKVLVSCMAYEGDRLLWIRRAEPPRAGYWFIPSGFMEQGESLREAASREFQEETGIHLPEGSLSLYAIGSLVNIDEIYVAFRARLPSTDFRPGPEVSGIGLFGEDDLPWDSLAFPEVAPQVRAFYEEVRQDRFGIWMGEYREGGSRVIPAMTAGEPGQG